MAVLGLAFARAFSSYGKWGLLPVEMCSLLIVLASLLAERGLKDRWAQLPISSYSLIIIYIQLKCIFFPNHFVFARNIHFLSFKMPGV